MPPIEQEELDQDAVLWMWTGVDRFNEPTRDEPIQLEVRWNRKRRQATGPNGTPIALDASVIVDREIVIGSLMMLGLLEDLVGTSNPEAEVMEVMTYSETTDLRGCEVRYELGLSRFRGTLPEFG